MRTVIAQPARPQVQACRPKVSGCSVSPRLAPVVARRDVSMQAGGRAKTTEETGPFLQKENSMGDKIREGFDDIIDSVKGDDTYQKTGSGDHYNKNYEKAAEKQEDLKDLRQELYGNAATKAQGAASNVKSAASDAKNKSGKAAEKTENAAGNALDAVKDKASEVVESVKNVAR